jgi:hypothetical protein
LPETLFLIDISSKPPLPVNITEEKYNELRSIDGITELSPMSSVGGVMEVNDLHGAVNVKLASASFVRSSRLKLLKGSLFDKDADNKIIITSGTLNLFNITPDTAIGKMASFELNLPKIDENGNVSDGEQFHAVSLEKTYEIVGVIDDDSEINVFLPMGAIGNINVPYYTQFKARVSDQENINNIESRIMQLGLVPIDASDASIGDSFNIQHKNSDGKNGDKWENFLSACKYTITKQDAGIDLELNTCGRIDSYDSSKTYGTFRIVMHVWSIGKYGEKKDSYLVSNEFTVEK